MRPDRAVDGRLRTIALVWIDALAYSLVLAVVVTAIAGIAAVATGGGLVRVKVLLFLIGFLLMGYGTLRLWPRSPSDLDDPRRPETGGDRSLAAEPDRTKFQALVRALPPARWVPPPPPEARMTPAGKVFVGSLLVLLVSYLMEAAFHVV